MENYCKTICKKNKPYIYLDSGFWVGAWTSDSNIHYRKFLYHPTMDGRIKELNNYLVQFYRNRE